MVRLHGPRFVADLYRQYLVSLNLRDVRAEQPTFHASAVSEAELHASAKLKRDFPLVAGKQSRRRLPFAVDIHEIHLIRP